LLTEDKDFGWLVFVSHANSAGVILIRYPGKARKALAEVILDLAQKESEKLRGSFVVIQPGQVRFSAKPSID
jgi:hypothetical protein